MSRFNGLPAHVLLVHFIVVLGPLTAALAILCALWPAARQRLVWLVLALSLIVAGLTPLTTEAGEWLEDRVGHSPLLEAHTELGDTMLYFSLALLVAGVLLAVVHLRAGRGQPLPTLLSVAVAAFVVVAGVAMIVQVYRVGDSGAKATWGQVAANPTR
ncbi:DUF2231 domain-containing protein [Mycolicibacterium sarraceniae]|uniref:DUF2231 domain-containing protein n=1 Tax=Mycolicibacterium sarraceniae TaxID=1534348 RepID=A0A7I7SM89_9MYCO|nr:DUF2231 domain-containing protein [Mycolicibacterium sarraceniae]BBY57650.1 hypothetical protein MSAR_07860 [Mycolicibacterium sarraceniae]